MSVSGVLRRSLLLSVAVLLFLTLMACGSGGGGALSPTPSTGPSPAVVPQYNHVAIVVMENKNYADVVSNGAMPYLMSLTAAGATTAQFFADVHPSIGNYFALTTGIAAPTDDSFSGVITNDNVVRTLVAAGKSWKMYAESLPSPGYLGGDVYPYLKRHAPLTYFSDVVSSPALAANVIPLTQLGTDLGSNALPNYMFLVPNAINDGHDCDPAINPCTTTAELAASDRWLQTNVGALLQNSEFKNSGLLIVVWDESADDNQHGGGRVFGLILGPGVKAGYSSNTFFQHESFLRLSMSALGISTAPGGGASAPPMTEFFQ